MNGYASKLQKLPWFIQRFGFLELLRKPVRMALAPWIIPRQRKLREFFRFDGWTYPYFYHWHNTTWASERCIEVPIAFRFIHGSDDVLEVGNVLRHYIPIQYMCVDKFETGFSDVDRCDIRDFRENEFDRIVSISTFEHIGFDDDPDEDAIIDALYHCRSLLRPGGRMLITASLDYNPAFDSLVRSNALGLNQSFMRKTKGGDWVQCGQDEALKCKRRVYPTATFIGTAMKTK